jgi:hypothetical protein
MILFYKCADATDSRVGNRSLRNTSIACPAKRTGAHATTSLRLSLSRSSGVFSRDENGSYALAPQGRPATAFLFELIARLQTLATVPMIDVRAYARWLVD